jgi:DNA invertase Pin-like site-specific DNA recombinase
MKNVILYVRVSTDEQAGRGYSLRDQEQKLINYCQNNNLNILEIFREDYSAKTFKRPEFKKLLDYCKKNKKDVHQLIFLKWDRFSRNTGESYQMISIFNDLAIEVNAIEQPLDLSIPEQGLMLAVYLSIPQVENHRRSLNIISGMRRAFKEGRYVGSAPKGYENGKDSSRKPLLIPGKDAKFVQEAFELMSTGLYNQIEVMNKLKKKGLSISKTPFCNLLKNPIYYGGVPIKAYKDEKECIVDGIHEPLISKALFDKVQNVFSSRRSMQRTNHKKINENFPLKGFLLCPKCNSQLTASASKGRSKYYTYYHCVSPCRSRYLIEDVHFWIEDYLKTISLDTPVKKLFEEMIKEALYNERDKKQLGAKHYEQIKNIESKLQRLQDIYIDGDIDKTEYQIAKTRYENIHSELKNKETEAINEKEVLELYKNAINKVGNTKDQYVEGDIDTKRRIIGSIFPNNFQFENKKVRTADLNPILLKIASVNGASRGQKKWDKSKKIDLSHTVKAEVLTLVNTYYTVNKCIDITFGTLCVNVIFAYNIAFIRINNIFGN